MQDQFKEEGKTAALDGKPAEVSEAVVSPVEAPPELFGESHQGLDEAHKQMRAMQKAAAQNWEHDPEQTEQTVDV